MATRGHGPLSAAELAEGAVLGDVALVLSFAGWILPFPFVFFAAATVPFAALTVRRRLRAVVVAAAASGTVAFLLGGFTLELNHILVAVLGLAVGLAYRWRWGWVRTALFSVPVVWLPTAAFTLVALAVFSRARKLTFKQIDISTKGSRKLFRRIGLDEVAHWGDTAVRWVIAHWWIAVPIAELVFLVGAVLLCRRIANPALRRLDAAFARPGPPADAEEAGEPAPLPVVLRDARYRFPGAEHDALRGIDMEVRPNTLVAVVGHNGSGKSTLARLLAGRSPTGGTVGRPGAAGLGQRGGTAVVFQRPESQVLGVRVADDLRWGLDVAEEVDVEGLLASVGLTGFGERETATLSGGELQRLAIAAALARHPALLVSDESTAMVDPAGRRQVMEVLRRLPAQGTAVVHVTHHMHEAAEADTVIVLEDGRVAANGPPDAVLGERAGV
jgi:energy-coupling factor transporter ATP-binding protein EcfA2